MSICRGSSPKWVPDQSPGEDIRHAYQSHLSECKRAEEVKNVLAFGRNLSIVHEANNGCQKGKSLLRHELGF